MAETERVSGISFSKEFEVVLGQYKAHIEYARGVGERVIGSLAVVLGIYYGYIRKIPDSAEQRTTLYVYFTGICFSPIVYLVLCINNSERCWKTYGWLRRLSDAHKIHLTDLGIINNEPRWVVWMWFGLFMILFSLFFVTEVNHFIGLPRLVTEQN
jgi:hypothetical protein